MLKVDFRFLEVSLELDSLNDLLVTIEDQEKSLSKLRLEEVNKQINSDSEEVEEWEILKHKYYYQTEHIYPKSFRGSYIVTLWATAESTLIEIANYIQFKKEVKLNFSDIRGNNIINRLEKYFTRVLGFKFFVRETLLKFDELYLLRNCFAHANGRMDALKDNDRNRLNKINEDMRLFEDNNGYILVHMEYLHSAYKLIRSELNLLIDQVKLWEDNLKKLSMK